MAQKPHPGLFFQGQQQGEVGDRVPALGDCHENSVRKDCLINIVTRLFVFANLTIFVFHSCDESCFSSRPMSCRVIHRVSGMSCLESLHSCMAEQSA